MTITKVVIYNEETREGRDNYGRKQKMEIPGRSFIYIVREAMNVRQLFNYVNSQGEWEELDE